MYLESLQTILKRKMVLPVQKPYLKLIEINIDEDIDKKNQIRIKH